MNLRKYLFTSSFIATITIVFVLLIAAGCAVILQKQVDLNQRNQLNPISSTDTTDWKTYRNEQYGFKVKYPNSFVKDFDENDSIFWHPIGLSNTDTFFGININPIMVNGPQEESVQYKLPEQIEVGGIKVVLTSAKSTEEYNRGRIYLEAQVNQGTNQYFIFASGYDTGIEDEFKIFLSTFKFIEPSNSSDSRCGNYERNGVITEQCAVCGDDVCEDYERCVPSNVGGGIATTDCGPLNCPEDCQNN
ncbi:MAG: PsbP-related protein [Patescibacteria group bacterium]